MFPVIDDDGIIVRGVPRRCSFCDKRREDVGHMLAGWGVWICDECVHRSDAILGDLEREKVAEA